MKEPTQQTIRKNLPLQARLATLELSDSRSFADLQAQSSDSAETAVETASPVFSVIFSTGERVRRFDCINETVYDEELVIDAAAIRLGRLNGGAPVLDTHEQSSLSNVIGVVVPDSVRIENGLARASIKLDTSEGNASTLNKVRAGIIRNISVGYVVHRFEVSCENDDAVPLYRATDWEPHEISLVPIGADSGAGIAGGVRSAANTWPCEINSTINLPHSTNQLDSTNQPKTMTDTNDTTNNDANSETDTNSTLNLTQEPMNTEPMINTHETEDDILDAAAGDVILSGESNFATEDGGILSHTTQSAQPSQLAQPVTSAQKDGIKLERSRVLEIQKIVTAAKLPESFSQQMIERGTSINGARKIVLDKLAQNSAATGEIRSVRVVRDEMESRSHLVENALLHRYNPDKFKLDPSAREFRGMHMMEIGRDLLERRGVKTRGLPRPELATQILGLETRGGYMGTSDFPMILSNIANKTLRAAYENAPQTFKAFCRKIIVPDFKMVTRLQLSDAPSLEKINESGEFKHGSLSESQEKYAIATYGKMVSFTRQSIINDDLESFTRIPGLFGQAAADLESDLVWGIITGNPLMGDGAELFHAKHGNVSSAGNTINIQNLGAARETLRKQKGLGGRFINVAAKYLMVPCSLETVAQQFMTPGIMYIKNPDVNPFAGTLQVIAEPRLDSVSATAWYMAGDPSQIDTIEYAYLEGNEGVNSEHRVGFDVDGMELRFRHDFGAKAIDWRALYRNAGAAVVDK